MSNIEEIVTVARLSVICPKAREDIIEAIVTEAPEEMPASGINNHIKAAHFIAQIAAETGGLQRLDENLFYTTAKRLVQVFPSKFKNEAAARPFLRNPEALANHVYAGKNGNTEAEDGWKYRGSGLIQLTGRANFADVAKITGIDIVTDPELARQPDSALQLALAYWRKKKISSVADSADEATVTAVTKLINPALAGLPDRKTFFRKAIKAFASAEEAALTSTSPAATAAMPTGAAAAAAPTTEELSGPLWVARFPTSKSIQDLASPFSKHVADFVDALTKAGANVRISATHRPKERAYLMHWAWQIGKKGFDPASVPRMAGVEIKWTHATPTKSRTAARQMVEKYGMVQIAALNSRHIERLAIDMTISWNGSLKIRESNGTTRTIGTQPRNGSNPALIKVGAGYQVIKLPSDPPHWSNDGR